MSLFNLFKKKESNLDYSCVNNDNVESYINKGELVRIYILSPMFGGQESIANQIIGTKEAEKEKEKIDQELASFLKQNKSVTKLHCDLKYKGESLVVSKAIVTAIVDGESYEKIINIW